MYYTPRGRFRPDARRARGRETRKRLLAAATHEFAARGYDGVTTRDIAKRARANQASIRYHFGGKKPLYFKVAAAIAEKHGAVLLPLIAKAQREHGNRDAAREALSAIIEAFLRQLLDRSDGGAAGMFVVREVSGSGEALAILYEGYVRALYEQVTVLLARATARLARAPDALIDARAMLGAVIAFASTRTAFRLRVSSQQVTQDRVDAVATRIAKLSQSMSAQVAPSKLEAMIAAYVPSTQSHRRRIPLGSSGSSSSDNARQVLPRQGAGLDHGAGADPMPVA